MKLSRREYVVSTGASMILAAVAGPLRALESTTEASLLIATNTYPWLTFANRAQQAFELHSDSLLAEISAAGITGYEPIINSAAEFNGLAERLQRRGLRMKSIYVNSTLHDTAMAEQSVTRVIDIADAAKRLKTEIVVTNPSPIQWGGEEDKSDAQLRFQAQTLDRLGAELRQRGMTLAYHNHDAELRQGAREFHHMLTATDPNNVKLCLDAHWIYRGCGNSEVALFDVVKHYSARIVELHLRQSTDGVWTESFAIDGDIDYARLFDELRMRHIRPHLVLEQAVEAATPNQFSAVEAHRRSRDNLVHYVSIDQ